MPSPSTLGTWREVLSGLRPVTAAPVLQIAADGGWEESITLPLPVDPDAAGAVLGQAADIARKDVALEVLWPGEAFIGVRWPRRATSEARAALEQVLTAAGSTPAATLTGQVIASTLSAALGAAPATGLGFVEVGAVNAWRSTGAEVIWRSDQVRDVEGVIAVLQRRPDLLECPHPVAVEFAVANPRPHWIGIQVSTIDGARHRLDQARLRELLQAVLPAGREPR